MPGLCGIKRGDTRGRTCREMRLLLDMNLFPSWVLMLQSAGHHVIHWSEVGAPSACDGDIFTYACEHHFVIVTRDLDFGAMLAARRANSPSIVQVRHDHFGPAHFGRDFLRTVQLHETALLRGALVTIAPRRIRCRVLPLSLRNPPHDW